MIAALYAGQLNSGINASWIISFLSNHPEWHKNCYNEVTRIANRYVPDRSLSLPERLARLPFEAWESDDEEAGVDDDGSPWDLDNQWPLVAAGRDDDV